MNINMSDFFKNNFSSETFSASVQIQDGNIKFPVRTDNSQFLSEGMKLLNSLMSGDTFTGFVSEIKDGTAFITMNNGAEISAKLSDGAMINAGQNVTFIVEENAGNRISIKPVLAGEQQAVLIDKALEAAGLGPTEDNINIVKGLLGLGMPVDSDTISQMARYSMQFPDASINTIANLMRLEIPVTSDNIKEFQIYSQFDGKIESLLSEVEQEFVSSMVSSSDDSSALNVFKDIISTIYEGFDGNAVQSSLAGDILSDTSAVELKNMLSNAGLNDIADNLMKTSVKEVLTRLLSGETFTDGNSLKEIINSKGFRELLHAAVNDTMKLTPRDVEEGEAAVSSYYKRIRKNVTTIESFLKSNDLQSSQGLSKSLSDIRSNIDFMNDLNKNMTYFQMPIKFSESEGNGELYVFTNKKKLANNTDNISAMLHLDMENLKSMDIYVNLSKGNNISTNFVLETEELLDFVYQHIDKLNERLEQLGYKTHFEMKVAQDADERLDFVKDFIEKDIRPASGGQYLFDVKA